MRQRTMISWCLVAILATAQAHSAASAGGTGRLAGSAALDLLGRYALADGRMLEVEHIGRQMRVALDGRELSLSPASPTSMTRWRTEDGTLALEFRAGTNGSVSGVTLHQRRNLR